MGFNKTAPNPSYERYKNILADTPEPEQSKGPGFNKLMGAAFRTENVIGSAMSRERFDAPETYDPAYDPLTEDNLKGYEAFSDKFVDVYSPEQNEAMKLQLDREIADREIIARGGLGGVGAAMFAGTVDPTILIPVGGTIKKGESLLRIGVKSAYAATAGAAVSEAILHSTQETRTAEESALAIGGATVLGGILGPTVVGGYRGLKGKPINGFDPIEYDGIVKRFEDEMTYDPDGDLNASDPEMLARIRADLEATGVYAGDTLDFQATALEAIVTTLARRQGLNPTEFYETEGPKLFGRTGEAGSVERGADVLGDVAEDVGADTTQSLADELKRVKAEFDEASKALASLKGFDEQAARRRAEDNLPSDLAQRISALEKKLQESDLSPEEDAALDAHLDEARAIIKSVVRKEKALAGDEAVKSGQERAKMLADLERTHDDAVADILRRREALKNRPLKQAATEGYKGADSGEAKEWLRAKAKGLDMSQEARIARARGMRFDTDTVLYHGTDAEFDSFRGLTWLTQNSTQASEVGGKTISVFVRLKNPATLNDFALARREAAREGLSAGAKLDARAAEILSAKGFDSIKDEKFAGVGGRGEEVVAVLDPSNIRSIHAAFDPDFSDSANLLAQKAGEMTRKQFQSEYMQHIDLRGRGAGDQAETAKLISEEGMREGFNTNLVRPYQGGQPKTVTDVNYAPKKGDYIYLVPKSHWTDTPNGPKSLAGYKPKPEELLIADKDYPDVYELYLAKSRGANLLAQQAADIGAARRQLSDDSSSLDLDESAAASINPIYRPEVLPPQRMKGSNREAAQFLEDTYTDEPITDFTAEISPERLDRIATQMAAETQLALASTGNAFDWYSAALDRTLSVAAVKYPMLTSDAAAQEAGLGTAANARFLFTYIMATTSQNLDVSANAKATYAAFGQMIDRWRAGNYTMDTERWGTGDKKKAMNINFAKFNEMLPKMPGKTVVDQLAAMDEMFRASRTVSEWTAAMKAAGIPYSPPGQTAKDAIVYGSSTLGPKIGNGFWQNLNGNFDPLTIDLWMRRTWGRLTGKSIGLEEALPGQRKRLKAAVKRSRSKQTKTDEYVASLEAELAGVRQQLEALSPKAFATKKTFNAEKKRLKAEEASLTEIVADAKGVKAPEPYRSEYNSDNEALLSYAKRLLKVWDTEYKRLVAKHGKDNVPDDMQPTWARAAKTIKANLGSPLDQVANGTQRQQIEKAGQLALEKLAARGIDVTMADMQALLWYPEKELWTSLTRKLNIDDDGVPIPIASNLNESYDAVFTRILGEQGYDSQAPEQIKGTGRAGTRRDGDQPSTEQLRDTRDRIEGADGEVVRGIGTELQQAGDGSGSGPERAGDGSGRDQGGSLFQQDRGQFNINTRELKLLEAADQSTLMHEASHWYLDTLFKIDGNEFVTKQLDEVLNWHGTKRDEVFDGDGNLTSKGVELQEAFAETFESYLQTGKAPIPRLQQVFDRFREWLTALYKALDPRERSNLTPEIKDVFDRMMAFEPGGTERLDLEAMRNPQSVGAAAVAEPTLEDYALAPSLKTADATAALRLNPLIRLATADSAAVREVAAQLLENAMYLGRNLEFKGSPNAVESVMREYEGWHAKAVTAAKKAYRALRKDKNVPNMTKRDFYEQVAYAMRRSDQSDNPHVAAAATAYREAVEKTKQRAIEAGLLPEDVSVKTASSYFHRMWNRNALTRKPNEFKDMTRAWLGDTFRSMQARAAQVEFDLDKLDAKASEADQKLLDQVKELEEIIETEGGLDGYAKTVADDIFETLMGHDARLVDTGFSLVPNARGPLKERTFNIPDLFEAKGAKVEDYLVNDAQEVMSRYMRVMSADIELTRTFGSPDLEAPIEKIKADYRKQIEALPKGSEKEARRLTNQMKNRIDDLNGVRDVIRGNYGEDNYDNMFARGAELVRAWNYMTMLGGMTVSALPDVGNKVIANGFFGMFRDMIGPLVTDLKGVKIAATEAKELGIAVEMALATRIASLADVGDMYGRGTQFERFVNGLSNRFTYATGMRHWNDIMKSGDYIAATNRAVRVMERPDRANKQAKAWLANLGIGEDDYKRIMAQVKKHGQKRHTMRLVHADKWDDAEAKRLWIGAMGKNANIQTVTPGAGDKLLVMNGDLGKTLGQFKSFAMAANQRVMIRGAQSARMGDARFVSGLATFVGMGMLVYYLKSQLSGRETSDDPVTWVREGVDRSGILPVFMEVFNTAEKVTGTTIVGDSPSSRYASRGAFASLLGPSVGRGEDVVSFAQGAFDGELKDRDLHAVRKLLPFNNIFYLRKLLDEFEIKATQDLDLEETSLSERRESVFEN